MNSREAPPPVETWVKSDALQNFLAALTESPPPITDVAPFLVASTTAFRTAFVPWANLGFSKAPTGPFINIVLEVLITSSKAFWVSGPASTPSNPSGILFTGTTLFSPFPEKSFVAKTSVARTSLTPFALALASIGCIHLIVFADWITDFTSVCFNKGICHAAAYD